MTDQPKLKPCPFCGGSVFKRCGAYDILVCQGCTVEVSEIRRWNRRPIEDALVEALEKAMKTLDRNQWGNIQGDAEQCPDCGVKWPNAEHQVTCEFREAIEAIEIALARAKGEA